MENNQQLELMEKINTEIDITGQIFDLLAKLNKLKIDDKKERIYLYDHIRILNKLCEKHSKNILKLSKVAKYL